MSTLLERARNGETLSDISIIDMHGHLGDINFGIPDNNTAALVEDMDRIGVQSITVSTMRCMSADVEPGNQMVYEAMQAFPGRILGYACAWPTSPEHVKGRMEHWLGQGFTGIKLHSATGHRYGIPAYEPAYAIANERKLPFLFHTWGQPDEFEDIRAIATKYPEIAILLAHSGCCEEAGYISLANDFENVYLDLAFSRSPRGLVQRLVEGTSAEKVTFGSDGLFFSLTQQIGKVLGADLSDEAKKKILGGNAAKLLARIQQ